jgi:fumarate reductase (CoM/CoB) subunit B
MLSTRVSRRRTPPPSPSRASHRTPGAPQAAPDRGWYAAAVSDRFSTDSVAKQLDYCTYCPKMCRHACPVSNASGIETFIPQAKMDRLNQARKGHVPWEPDSVDPIWACTGCRHCTVYCKHENEPGLVLISGRAEAQARGAGHPALQNYPGRFHNRERRLVEQLHEQVPETQRSDDALIGFWPGCDAVDKQPRELQPALDMLAHVGGVSVSIVDIGQTCAGYPLLAAGHPEAFRWHAGKVAAGLKRFRTVIVGCSACVYTLRTSYPAEGLEMATEIVSVPEFLARSLRSLPEQREKKVVYYHDPCFLARYAGVIDEPRQVLARVAEVRELAWSGEDTECCGGAGLLPKTMPDVADAMARRRLREVVRGGGGTVVTSCPTCAFMLQRNAPDGVEVRMLSDVLAESLSETLSEKH